MSAALREPADRPALRADQDIDRRIDELGRRVRDQLEAGGLTLGEADRLIAWMLSNVDGAGTASVRDLFARIEALLSGASPDPAARAELFWRLGPVA